MFEDFEDLLKFKEVVAKLAMLPTPLYRNEPLGQIVLDLMLSPYGKKVRLFSKKIRPTCTSFPRGIFILSDGSVTTCCNDTLGRNTFGSIYQTNLKEIWESAVSKIIHGDLYDMPVCRGCIGSPPESLTSSPQGISKWHEKAAGYPDYIQIEIMAACNYGCCISPYIHQIRPVKPDLNAIYSGICNFIPHVKELNMFNHGEPLLHEDLGSFVGKCRNSSKTVCINIATNGMLLDEQFSKAFIIHKVDRLIVSVHGGPGTENMLKYSKYGANYEIVIANLHRLLEIRREAGSQFPQISLKAILFNWNDNDSDMDKFRIDAKKLGLVAGNSGDTDNYYWILNAEGPNSPRSSCKFIPGSPEFNQLIETSELCL